MDRDDFDYTALHYAARNGNVEICKMLIEDGKADVDAITKSGATALHRASMMGNYLLYLKSLNTYLSLDLVIGLVILF